MQNEQKEMSLNELENGECGYVTVLDTNISLRSRLRELGLIEGTKVTKVTKGTKISIIIFEVLIGLFQIYVHFVHLTLESAVSPYK